MKLSDIDTSVWYPIEIPSTGKKTTFRPFRVREERSLLMAQESEEAGTMLNTLNEVVKSCLKDKVELTTFDVEYLFIKIRSKSVGEDSYVVAKCGSCDAKNNVVLQLTDTVVTNLDQNKKLKISDDLSVIMKYPSVTDIAKIESLPQKEQVTAAITACIESVFYKTTVFHTAESDAEEIADFLLNRTDDEISKLIEFVENIPTVQLKTEYECKQCGAINQITVNSIADFF